MVGMAWPKEEINIVWERSGIYFENFLNFSCPISNNLGFVVEITPKNNKQKQYLGENYNLKIGLI